MINQTTKVVVFSTSRSDYGAAFNTHEALKEKFLRLSLYRVWNQPLEVVASMPYLPEISDTELAVVIGDRFETLYATVGLYHQKIPIAHLNGGDITEGSQDDCMRHAITKMAHIHFVTNEDAARRVIQMGEDPGRVHVVGDPELDNLKITDYSVEPVILVCWHPNTLGDTDAETRVLIEALEKAKHSYKTLIVGPNGDVGHEIIRSYMKDYAASTYKVQYVDNLDRQDFINLMAKAVVMVGNSSAAIYEAPQWGTPVVNVGDRQKGRIMATNVMSCAIDSEAITHCIESTILAGRQNRHIINPYGDGHAGERIAEILGNIEDPKKLLRKVWHDVRPEMGRDTQIEIVGEVPKGGTSQMDFEELRWDTTKFETSGEDIGFGSWAGGLNVVPGTGGL